MPLPDLPIMVILVFSLFRDTETLKMNIFPDKIYLHDPYWSNPGDENSC
jgi:hypothetical protein